MSISGPATHQAHEIPLADRIVDRAIGEWLDRGYRIATCTADPKFSEYERGKCQGFEEMRHLHLANWSYTVSLEIVSSLRRAGLLVDRPD